MFHQPSPEHFHLTPLQVAPVILTQDSIDTDEKAIGVLEELRLLGIGFDGLVDIDQEGTGMDALQPTITTASITTPVQFLQNWLPGFVNVITAVRQIDSLVGITTSGSWEDEQIVQGIMELTGTSVPYGDYSNIPLSSWNVNFEWRTVVRFEEGLQVGILEQKRAARIRQDSGGNKRSASALALEIQRNLVGFYGYNDGTNKTYGFLNDPGLLAYEPVAANDQGNTEWADKDYLQIFTDIQTAAGQLLTQSQGTVNPYKVPTTLAVATDAFIWLTKTTIYGNTVLEQLQKVFPRMRFEQAPELNDAHMDENVFYLYADAVDGDGSTDDSRTWVQVVPAKFQVLGVQQNAKSYIEDYSNATAGVMLKRPYAVTRYYGI